MPLFAANTLMLMVVALTVSSDLLFLSWDYFSLSSQTMIITYTFFPSSHFTFYLSWALDFKAAVFITSVSLISVGVLGFSAEYMAPEKFFSRFHFLVLIFICSMFLLILSSDLMSLLIGWDGLGVSSFLLVVYFQTNNSWGAGMLTVMTNRVGDVLLILSCALVAYSGLPEPMVLASTDSWVSLTLLLLFIVAASTKSAQLPFSAWLPAAMAAPTPVSSLVHSSTLVTAGVYLLIRFEAALNIYGCNELMLFMGTVTMAVAGRAALWEPDLKKLVALSTLSQLGLMVATLGLGQPNMAFFHLIMHAFFKSLLFMATGTVIHALGDYQDMRMVALSPQAAPFSFSLITVSNFSLMGLPFMSGFYSKDFILETTFTHPLSLILWALFFLGTMLTMAYSMRFMLLLGGSSAKQTLFWSGEQGTLLLKTCGSQLILAILAGRLLSKTCPFETSFIFLEQWMKLLVLIFIVGSLLTARLSLATFFTGPPQKTSFLTPGSIGGAPNAVKGSGVSDLMRSSLYAVETSELFTAPSFSYLSGTKATASKSMWASSNQKFPTYLTALGLLLLGVLIFVF